jgi:hypothetical protein
MCCCGSLMASDTLRLVIDEADAGSAQHWSFANLSFPLPSSELSGSILNFPGNRIGSRKRRGKPGTRA